MNTDIEKSVEILAPLSSLVVATGAGMSKESGIPYKILRQWWDERYSPEWTMTGKKQKGV